MRTTILPHRRGFLRLVAILLLLAGLVCWVSTAAEAPDRALFRDIDHILAGLSEITGFPVRRQVLAEVIGKDKLREYLERRIREEVKPEDLRIEELTLKMFGLIPQDFDLKKATVDLISEQAAAFYDPSKRRLSIIEAPTADIEKRAALVHELAHAIADQQFRLERYMKKGNTNDDAATARQAVMEGQATWLMWAYVNREGGGEADVGPAALAAMEATADSTSSQYPMLEGAPMYLRESLLFPYTKGLQFQDAIYRKLGKRAFAEVFRDPPRSTQQILHPDEYLAGTEYPEPQPPRVPDEKKYHKLADGALGEFDEYLLLKQFTTDNEARRVSRGWRGGVYRVLESKKGRRPVLAFTAVWDSEETARTFQADYEQVLRKKWKRFEDRSSSGTAIAGSGDSGRFVLRWDGTRVTSIEGLPEPAIH